MAEPTPAQVALQTEQTFPTRYVREVRLFPGGGRCTPCVASPSGINYNKTEIIPSIVYITMAVTTDTTISKMPPHRVPIKFELPWVYTTDITELKKENITRPKADTAYQKVAINGGEALENIASGKNPREKIRK